MSKVSIEFFIQQINFRGTVFISTWVQRLLMSVYDLGAFTLLRVFGLVVVPRESTFNNLFLIVSHEVNLYLIGKGETIIYFNITDDIEIF